MKKVITVAALALLLALPLGTVPAHAVTPAYRPVSSQSWYSSYQSALKSAYRAGQNAAKNIKINVTLPDIK